MKPLINNPKKFAVVVITQEEALIWKNGFENNEKPNSIFPPLEVDHRHKRTGQNRKGHDTVHRFPEYFEDIASQVIDSQGILLLGHGQGSSSYVDNFKKYLSNHNPDIHARIVETLKVNVTAISRHEILKIAKEWYEKSYGQLSTWHERQIDRRLL